MKEPAKFSCDYPKGKPKIPILKPAIVHCVSGFFHNDSQQTNIIVGRTQQKNQPKKKKKSAAIKESTTAKYSEAPPL
jgi:hypothetical protein